MITITVIWGKTWTRKKRYYIEGSLLKLFKAAFKSCCCFVVLLYCCFIVVVVDGGDDND